MLAWHGFADEPVPGLGTLTETFPRFEEMLRFLEENGFRSVFPEQVRPGRIGRRKEVILTFDDGRKEQVRAAEMLERHGFRGIFFVIPNRTRAGDPRFLSPDDVARLVRAGHRVAAHGYDHRSLPSSGTEVAASLVRSAGMLAAHAGERRPAPDFAFPFGHYTAEIAEAVAGRYRWLHTVNPGYWDGASALVPRMLVMTGVDPALFRDYVLGGARYHPTLRPLTPDGAVAGRIAFLSRETMPDSLELFAITADASGESYVSRPLGDLAQVAGDTLWVDLAGYMRRRYPPGRMVISYAVMRREGGELRYASPGVLHWTADPVTGPRAMPQRRDTIPAPGGR